jgi:hypothetical protein
MTKPSRYARDPGYPEPPDWGALYAQHFPERACAASRHVRMMSEYLRDIRDPLRRRMISIGHEPDHWASSMEATVKALWEARARLAELEGKG